MKPVAIPLQALMKARELIREAAGMMDYPSSNAKDIETCLRTRLYHAAGRLTYYIEEATIDITVPVKDHD